MAIILRGTLRCALCAEVLGETDDVVATTHFIHEQADPLWRFSDAGMHRQCFLAWSDRQAFVDRFNSTVGQVVWGNGTQQRMLADGTIDVYRHENPAAG